MKKPDLLKVAEVRITYKNPIKPKDRLTIKGSIDTYNIFKSMPNYVEDIENVEMFSVMYLNRQLKVLGVNNFSKGSITGTVADPQEIFEGMIKAKASSVVLCHNHPSGNKKPSDADISLTKKIKEGCRILCKELCDHVIITPNDEYFSFADEGML